jgi:hypothetical protein
MLNNMAPQVGARAPVDGKSRMSSTQGSIRAPFHLAHEVGLRAVAEFWAE